MIIKHVNDIPAPPITSEGASKASIRVIFGPKDGAPNFAMRQIDLAAAGHTPFHKHPFEHQAFILHGAVALVTDDGELHLTPGDAVMIMPGKIHQFRNLSNTDTAKFICMIPGEYQK